jgi:hypothetical protein
LAAEKNAYFGLGLISGGLGRASAGHHPDRKQIAAQTNGRRQLTQVGPRISPGVGMG